MHRLFFLITSCSLISISSLYSMEGHPKQEVTLTLKEINHKFNTATQNIFQILEKNINQDYLRHYNRLLYFTQSAYKYNSSASLTTFKAIGNSLIKDQITAKTTLLLEKIDINKSLEESSINPTIEKSGEETTVSPSSSLLGSLYNYLANSSTKIAEDTLKDESTFNAKYTSADLKAAFFSNNITSIATEIENNDNPYLDKITKIVEEMNHYKIALNAKTINDVTKACNTINGISNSITTLIQK